MRIVGAVSIRLVDGVGINLRAAGRLGEPTEEFGVLARRLGGENERFTVGLLCFLCCAVTEIPRQRIAVGGKLRIEGFCRCDSHGVVQAAARNGRVPALKRMTGLDRRTCRSGCGRIGLARRGDTGLAVDGAAVRSGIPCEGQRNCCAAVVADTIRVGIHMVGVFFATCLADGTGLRALMLGIAYA